MIYKSILLILGYLYGTMLTATFVVKHSTGNDVSKIGSGNPGMANVMEHIGKKEGVLVLAGDILKVIVAGILGRLLFPDKTWHDIFLYTGFGAIFGHNYPLWRKGKGGKGVTVTCTWLILTFGVLGAICCIIGGMVVLLTGWLPLGGYVKIAGMIDESMDTEQMKQPEQPWEFRSNGIFYTWKLHRTCMCTDCNCPYVDSAS